MQSADRVQAVTSGEVNRQLQQDALNRVRHFEHLPEAAMDQRIRELEREWDIERVLATNASILGLTGVVLGATVSRKWLALPGVVLPFLLQHALQGWCPPLPLFRRLGIRTRQEIEREKFAMMALRGDFDRKVDTAEDAFAAAAP
jgi:hypothetical protein